MVVYGQVEDDWLNLGVMTIGLMIDRKNGETCTANSIRKTCRSTAYFYDCASELVRIKVRTWWRG